MVSLLIRNKDAETYRLDTREDLARCRAHGRHDFT